MILLPGTAVEQASILAKKILWIVDQHHFGTVNHLTISLGITNVISDDTLDSVDARVDGAMYWAKDNGRNQIKLIAVKEKDDTIVAPE